MALQAEKLAALRKFFGMPDSLELPIALAGMRAAMGMETLEGNLVEQLDALGAATKNTTREEVKPVLQRYFRGLRRHITLSEEEHLMYAIDAVADRDNTPAATMRVC